MYKETKQTEHIQAMYIVCIFTLFVLSTDYLIKPKLIMTPQLVDFNNTQVRVIRQIEHKGLCIRLDLSNIEQPCFNSADILKIVTLDKPIREWISLYEVLSLTQRTNEKDAEWIYNFTGTMMADNQDIYGDFFAKLYSACRLKSLWRLGKEDQVKKTSVYLVKNPDNGLTKIGVSNNIPKRFGTIGSKESSLEPVGIFEFNERNNAFAAENKLHRHYSTCRIKGEWFCLDSTQLDEAKNILAFTQNDQGFQ